MPRTHLLDTSVYSQHIRPAMPKSVARRWAAVGDAAMVIASICDAEVLYDIRKAGSVRLLRDYDFAMKGRYHVHGRRWSGRCHLRRLARRMRTAGLQRAGHGPPDCRHRPPRRRRPPRRGFYKTASGEAKAYLHIGPKFGTVSKQAVNNATKACRRRGDADWLIILGFSFESDIESKSVTTSQGQFQVTKVRMHDDLLQEGLLKKDKKAASFVTIGEPDIALHVGRASRPTSGKTSGKSGIKPDPQSDQTATVEIKGLDIYDPIKDEVKSRDVHDIAYWMVDTDYDGANFIVRQAFFCGGDKDEFDAWKKGLENLALLGAKKKAEKTLKIEIDEEAFARLYGHQSHPFPVKKGQQIAVRVISQFGEETTKVLDLK